MATLKQLRDTYGPQGLEIVGVCLDNDTAKAQAFLKQHGYSWPQLHEKGAMESSLAVQYGIIVLPYAMLVDADGRVINPNLQSTQVEQQVQQALAQKVANRNR